MNDIQQKILEKVSTNSLDNLTLREIGKAVSPTPLHPQTVKYYLEKLERKGYISINFKSKIIRRINSDDTSESNLIAIPILGAANCGEATMVASDYIEGHLRLSSKLLDKEVKIKKNNIFALEASGDSMDLAQIGEEKLPVKDGDYVLIDNSKQSPNNGDYILSIIDGLANIKKFKSDKVNNRIMLLSESTKNYPPIIISGDDLLSYFVNGLVLQVIKKVK